MARISGKKLPPHWVYVPSRRELRELLQVMNADIRGVELRGTGHDWGYALSLGYLERRVVRCAWCFYLWLWGVRESAVGEHRDELAQAAIKAIKQSIGECITSPPAEVIKPTELRLYFSIDKDGIDNQCKVYPVSQFSSWRGRWWEESDEL